MKSAAILVVGVAVLIGGSLHANAAHRQQHRSPGSMFFLVPVGRADLANLALQRVMVPAVASPTATPTVASLTITPTVGAPTATATAGTPTATTTPLTPTPTATPGPQYPDPQTLLQNAVQTLAAINSVHFNEVALQQGPVNFKIQASGDSTCAPALRAHVTATRSIPGTLSSAKHAFYVIEFKNSVFWKYKRTKNRWQPTKDAAVGKFAFGFTPQFPLICPNLPSSGAGSGGGASVTKDLVNVGPDTVNGVSVWHLHETLVTADAQGNVSELPIDLYIGQTNPLIYRDVTSFTDTSHGISGSITTTRSKFGEHIKISKPKKGSKKP